MNFFQSQKLPVYSVSLSNPMKDSYEYLEISLQVFPSGQDCFNQTEISRIGFMLSRQFFQPPPAFGPFNFMPGHVPYDYYVGKLEFTF